MAPSSTEQLSGVPGGPSAGSQVGTYQILGKIGSGGMATVYLARATGAGGFEREVALKLVHQHLAEDEENSSHLLREARLAARIRHRNVVQVLDVGEANGALYLVMEYVEGGTLEALFRKAAARGETIPIPIALRLIADSLSGLHAAHEAEDDAGKPLGLVHRDFSPQNILAGIDGSVKLADFGIAKLTRSLNQTRSGTLKGKASYMAPEQVRSLHLDRRCDVWAAGVVAWELLAGERLQPRLDDEMATLMRILTMRPRPIRAVNPKVSEAIERAVAHALEQRLDKRCSSAREFRDELLDAARMSGVELSDSTAVALYVQSEMGDVLTTRRAKIAAGRKPDESLLVSDAAPEAGQTRTGFSSRVRGGASRRDRRWVFVALAATLTALGVMAGRFSAPVANPEGFVTAAPARDAPPLAPVATFSMPGLPGAAGTSEAPAGLATSATTAQGTSGKGASPRSMPSAQNPPARKPRIDRQPEVPAAPRANPAGPVSPKEALAPNPYRDRASPR